jgi:hypothetical protein
MDISSRFDHFIAFICPSNEQREKADEWAAKLGTCLKKRIADDGRYHLEKIFRSGSSAKSTDLAPRGKGTFDIDLGFYFRAQGQPEEQLQKLLPYLRLCLREIYPPNKPEEDFHHGKNAINVTFRTCNLKIDIVPIVREVALEPGKRNLRNWGWIPRSDGERRLTSISAHIHFIHWRTHLSNQVLGPVKFNHLVRLMKWWNRRLPEHIQRYCCSYFYELITAAALEKHGVTTEWQSSLERIFSFIDQNAFLRPIAFSSYDLRKIKYSSGKVIVLDAVNPENNVTNKWTNEFKQKYLQQVRETLNLIKQARKHERMGREDDALDTWCQIFGEEFRHVGQ